MEEIFNALKQSISAQQFNEILEKYKENNIDSPLSYIIKNYNKFKKYLTLSHWKQLTNVYGKYQEQLGITALMLAIQNPISDEYFAELLQVSSKLQSRCGYTALMDACTQGYKCSDYQILQLIQNENGITDYQGYCALNHLLIYDIPANQKQLLVLNLLNELNQVSFDLIIEQKMYFEVQDSLPVTYLNVKNVTKLQNEVLIYKKMLEDEQFLEEVKLIEMKKYKAKQVYKTIQQLSE
ncbi:Hypothetical_protein [Hexamita inflata]|uniref:Hypothetical_protein n=1 Tax=Hexamita inflata TaxID=28002 RepID=A0ABP1HH92_9EUKA